MKYLFVLAGLVMSIFCNAQSNKENELVVVQNKPLTFSYLSPEDLLQPQIIKNAFHVKYTGGPMTSNVYAMLVPQGLPNESSRSLSLQLNYKSGGTGKESQTNVQLTTVPTLLFTTPAAGQNGQQQNFIYDIILMPPKSFTNTGSFNFSIVFSQTLQ